MAEARRLTTLLGAGVEVAEGTISAVPTVDLHPREEAAIAGAVRARRREFAVGRELARRALAQLGVEGRRAIPVGPAREPVWPEGIVGSITHSGDYCAAAVAPAADFLALGIDAELDRPLPAELVGDIASAAELCGLPRGPNWATLIFSAKESAFKAWFPLGGRWLDFDQASVRIQPEQRLFQVHLGIDDLPGSAPRAFLGRFDFGGGLVFTSVCLRRARNRRARPAPPAPTPRRRRNVRRQRGAA